MINAKKKGNDRDLKGKFAKGHKQFNSGRTHFKKGQIPENGFKKEHIPHNKKPDTTCEKCDKVLSRHCYKRCSDCKFKTGKQHPNFKHGLSDTKEYKRVKESRRRAKIRNCDGDFTLLEWKQLKDKFKNTCPSCLKSEPKIKLTIDHIVPLISGGRHSVENIQPLCESCNFSKHTKTIKYELKA